MKSCLHHKGWMLGILLLAGCASNTVTPQYYTIALPKAQNENSQVNSLPVVQVNDISLADYLDNMGIVFQKNDVEVVTANQNRWAEPLGKQLTNSLVQGLQQQLPEFQWNNQLLSPNSKTQPQLQVRVTGFHGTADGHAIISGQWVFWQNQQQFSGQFQHTYPLSDNGYASLVRELKTGWQSTIIEIAAQIRPLLTQAKSTRMTTKNE